jgi:hypothetical protein
MRKATSCSNLLRGWSDQPAGFKKQEKHFFLPGIETQFLGRPRGGNVILQILKKMTGNPVGFHKVQGKLRIQEIPKFVFRLCLLIEFCVPIVQDYTILCPDCAGLST